ncbi:MAG: hypothetical protein QM576_03710 [Rhodopseudomonas sp.]|uniref:hypothetical protein n=1 Tax=unclassified Rhodopseudomonas TaxID=2638247 RepID=UPI0013DF5BB1|nr:hypothetical protein [Rhodopseudomonas sp. BR0M22]MCD0419407.1 hypothetical protein [Rubrivivax sp. JA1024]
MANVDAEQQSKHNEPFDSARSEAERPGLAMRVWARHRLRELAESGRLGIGVVAERRRG